MILFLVYFVFLAILSAAGVAIGYESEAYYAGTGNFVVVAIFMVALWAAWVAAVWVCDRFWPDQQEAPDTSGKALPPQG
jgi:hypothetical protein